MIIIALLAVLFALFFLIKKHTGPAMLAVIAGYSVYQTFGGQFLELAKHFAPESIPEAYIQAGICGLFVAVFPIILYLRSYHGGLFGILRIAEAAVMACIMTMLLAPVLTKLDFLSFDALSQQIVDFIKNYEGIIMLAGIGSAYFDILMYRE